METLKATNSTGRGSGIGIFSLLGIAFVILKLIGTITWPWLWVVAPFWMPIAALLGIAILVGIVVFIISLFK